jgi:hypothetical protein
MRSYYFPYILGIDLKLIKIKIHIFLILFIL